jgi:hypothetical protein
MQKISFCLKLFVALAIVFSINACEEDIGGPGGGGGGTGTAPDVFLSSGAGLVDFSATVNDGEVFTIELNGSAGDDEMNSVTVTEDGLSVASSRLSINGDVGNNPALLVGGERTSFTWTIDVTAHSDASTKTYEFEVADAAGRTNSATVSITVNAAMPMLSVIGNTDIDACPAEGFLIRISATLGEGDLSTISVTENGTPVSVDKLNYLLDGILTPFVNNPDNLPTELVGGFADQEFVFRAPEATGTITYVITVEDINGQTGSANIDFTVDASAAGMSASIQVFNNSGPKPGGADLDALLQISSTQDDADIVDAGNDGGGNWQMKIVPDNVNGAVIRAIDETVGCNISGFDFSEITYAVLIENAFNNGIDISETDALEVGDRFTAMANGKHYLIEVVVKDMSDAANDNQFFQLNVVRARD